MAGPLGFTSYSVENDEAFARAMERSIRAVKDLKIPLAMISKDFMKSRRAIFLLKGPGGYPDLKPATKRTKERVIGQAYPILRFSGDLERSVTEEKDSDNINRIKPQSLEMGTSIPYGVYHQEGRGVPLRKFLFIGPESVKFASKEISGFPERSMNTLNTYVLREMGLNIEQATGVKPIIKKGKA